MPRLMSIDGENLHVMHLPHSTVRYLALPRIDRIQLFIEQRDDASMATRGIVICPRYEKLSLAAQNAITNVDDIATRFNFDDACARKLSHVMKMQNGFHATFARSALLSSLFIS